MQNDYDSPWKQAIEKFFPDFMNFFFPDINNDIDWSKGYEFLDKDLKRITRDAEIGNRYADKLVKVWLKNGDTIWVLIHIEVQSSRVSNFSERIYVYRHRIWEQYNVEVASLVILCDDEKSYRPNQYKKAIWGCELSFKFPIIKLLDYVRDWAKIESNNNPFAIIVMAQLKAKLLKDDLERKDWKFSLTKRLYERNYSKQDILELYTFIDWILALPENLEKKFLRELSEFEKEKAMQYVTSAERFGRQDGIQIGLLQSSREAAIEALEINLDISAPKDLIIQVNQETDLAKLKEMLRKAIKVSSLGEFQVWLKSKSE
ncbi:MAG: hypothetical protein HON94_03640 [Methylococcales bacterium]|nr:hypothetical protein [Methylococcales bacterium]MBT7409310.1 hypothetical protein [Methylococcales bacterium]